jgi:HMG-box domain
MFTLSSLYLPVGPLSAYNLFFKDERARMLTDVEEQKATTSNQSSGMKRKGVDEYSIEPGSFDIFEENDNDNGDDDLKLPALRHVINHADDAEGEEQEISLQMSKKGKIGFAAMAQAIAAKWKLIDEQTLSNYREIASEDQKRYRKEMETYNKQDGDGGGNGDGGKNDYV